MQIKQLRKLMYSLLLGVTLIGNASAKNVAAPILLHPSTASEAFAIAAYKGMQAENFSKMVSTAFENAGFSSRTSERMKDGTVRYTFAYPVAMEGQVQNIEVVLRTDENIDKKGRCATCFLRTTVLTDFAHLQQAPWMLQYAVNRQVLPAIDQAYASIQQDGQAFMDGSLGFDYKNQWQGEKNLYENSFVGIEQTSLKSTVIDAYRAAGFIFQGDIRKDLRVSDLVFSFPVDPDQAEGVVYKISLASQLDASDRCYPCEITEVYDPYQKLPAAGLSGMSKRLTLESRFAASRALALEKLKNSTAQFLRAGTMFTMPPKPAPLGSPRPHIRPMTVT